jgi:hypothetical protein
MMVIWLIVVWLFGLKFQMVIWLIIELVLPLSISLPRFIARAS